MFLVYYNNNKYCFYSSEFETKVLSDQKDLNDWLLFCLEQKKTKFILHENATHNELIPMLKTVGLNWSMVNDSIFNVLLRLFE